MDQAAAQYLVEQYYDRSQRGFKGCHPRDIVEILSDICIFYGEQATFSHRYLDQACHSYFVALQDEDQRLKQEAAFGGLSSAPAA